MSWRFYLMDLPSGRWVDKDLPLVADDVTEACSAPASIKGALPIEFAALKNPDGTLSIRKWGSLIVAEQEGRDPVAGIVDNLTIDGQSLAIEAGGFTMYPTGMPWLGDDFAGIKVDPMDMYRKVMDHLLSYGNVGLDVAVDGTKSPVRIGEPERDVSFETSDGDSVEFETGPFRLARWDTEDLGKVLDDLAADTPFQYREHSWWDGEDLCHRIELGYPKLGVRRPNATFEIGINVTANPVLDESDYASEVLVTGAGEGRKKVSAHLTQKSDRMRRVQVVADSSLRSKKTATNAARPILDGLRGGWIIDSLDIVDHGLAPFGTFDVGDEVRVVGDAGWADVDMWVRIQEMSINPASGATNLKVEEV